MAINMTTDFLTDTTMTTNSSLQDLQDELDKTEDFEKLLKKIDSMQETSEERAARLEAEDKEVQARKDRTKKMNELQSLIAQLRSQLAASGGDPAIAARLSEAQTELFWLMMSL